MKRTQFDFVVVGSGFSGSIMAMGLVKSGFSVCMIEKGKHPRFAIGESSTPIADMILRDLADDYDLPFLRKLSRYGDWQKNYPDLICGLKRGFSYYTHQKETPFCSNQNHHNELLVAASFDDENSDTNWLRSDIDNFLVIQAKRIGVDFLDQTEITELKRNKDINCWNITIKDSKGNQNMKCNWIIDATGSPFFSETFFGTKSSSKDFQTNSEAIFTHFEDVTHWSSFLQQNSFYMSDYPYNPDFSALHHIIEEGWVWMLRFNNDLLSSGILIDRNDINNVTDSPGDIWSEIIQSYPSLKTIFKDRQLAKIPGKFFKTGRLQRKLDRSFGDGWVALNHTTGFTDPLHSTGIAFALSGVEKLLSIFSVYNLNDQIINRLEKFQDQTFKELHLIDLMVSSCYHSRWNFELFTASVMLYFIASVQYEQSRIRGKKPDAFLCAEDEKLTEVISQTHFDIRSIQKKSSGKMIKDLTNNIKKRIAPYNTVGLLDEEKNNMYRHTAVSFK